MSKQFEEILAKLDARAEEARLIRLVVGLVSKQPIEPTCVIALRAGIPERKLTEILRKLKAEGIVDMCFGSYPDVGIYRMPCARLAKHLISQPAPLNP